MDFFSFLSASTSINQYCGVKEVLQGGATRIFLLTLLSCAARDETKLEVHIIGQKMSTWTFISAMMTMVTIMMLVVLVVVMSTGRRFLSLIDFLSKIFSDVIKLQILSVVDVNVGVDGTVAARVVVAVVGVVFVVVVGSLSVSDSIRRYNVVYFVGQGFDLAAARKCFQIEAMGSNLGCLASLWFL